MKTTMHTLASITLLALCSLLAGQTPTELNSAPDEKRASPDLQSVKRNEATLSSFRIRVYRTQDELDASPYSEQVGAVDWASKSVLEISAGAKPSSGYSIEFKRIERAGNQWLVHFVETSPPAGSVQPTLPTQPYDIDVVERVPEGVEVLFFDDPAVQREREPLPVRGRLPAGHLTHTENAHVHLIRSQAELDAKGWSFLGKRVDFESQSIVVVAAGVRMSTGYGIRVDEVYRIGETIRVRVTLLNPKAGQAVGYAITYPHDVVIIDRVMDDVKQIEFEDKTLNSRPVRRSDWSKVGLPPHHTLPGTRTQVD